MSEVETGMGFAQLLAGWPAWLGAIVLLVVVLVIGLRGPAMLRAWRGGGRGGATVAAQHQAMTQVVGEMREVVSGYQKQLDSSRRALNEATQRSAEALRDQAKAMNSMVEQYHQEIGELRELNQSLFSRLEALSK